MMFYIIKDGVSIVYISYLDIKMKEHLVSGLLTALNQFVFSEFNQAIDSINMGGLNWIYDYDEKNNMLYVAADKKDSEITTMSSRLAYVKTVFSQQYIDSGILDTWDGNIGLFKPFKELIDEVYKSWQTMEDKLAYLELFDYIRIFQQILDLAQTVIVNQLDPKKTEAIQNKLENFYLEFKENQEIQDKIELDKFTYSNNSGFKFFGVNPENCEIYILKRELKNILSMVILTIREILGNDLALNYFKEYKLTNYILENLPILNKFEITEYMLFLLWSD